MTHVPGSRFGEVVRLVPRSAPAGAAAGGETPAKALARFEEARQVMIAEYIAWMRHGHPGRADAMLEAEGTAAQMRQLATLNTTYNGE